MQSAQSVESVLGQSTGAADVVTVPGLEFPRSFTRDGIDPFDAVEWETRSAIIGNEKGNVVFEQRDVEIPKTWSQQATNIVVS
jgi:ribonucleoside-diphosphate reductase alpha chain